MSEYNPNLYPNLDCPLETATETDEELFNNLFDEDNLPLTARKMEEFKLICKK